MKQTFAAAVNKKKKKKSPVLPQRITNNPQKRELELFGQETETWLMFDKAVNCTVAQAVSLNVSRC